MDRSSNSPDHSTGTVVTSEPIVRICAPGNVGGWAHSASAATLTWDEPYAACAICPNATGYEVSGQGFTTRAVVRPPCEITGLKPATEYLMNVVAKAGANNISNPSLYRLVTPALQAPSQPGVPVASDVTYNSVQLTWAPSTDNGGTIRYRIYLNGSLLKVVNQPNARLAHLRNVTDYQVEVRAINAAGTSEPVSTAFRTLLRPPMNLKFSHVNGTCRLSWDPVYLQRPTHELVINGKTVNIEAGHWSYRFQLAVVSPGPAPHHFNFSIRAHLGGESSIAVPFQKTLTDGVPPSRPGKLSVSAITNTSATLAWEPSSDNIEVADYRVVLNGLVLFTTEVTRLTFNGLTAGVYHLAAVRARDKEGNFSALSSHVGFKTTGQPPLPRPATPAIKITPRASTTAYLEWSFDESVGRPIGARIMMNGGWLLDVHLPGILIPSLAPDTEYTFSVHAFDVYKQLSEPATLVYVPKDITPPSAPGNLRQSTPTASSVTLTWTRSTDDIGIHEYIIYNDHEHFDSTSATTYTANDLPPGRYSFDVCAIDLSGNASAPASIVVNIEDQELTTPGDGA